MTVEAYWARLFALDERELGEPGLRVVPHAALATYQGVWLWWHGDSTIVDVSPDRLLEAVTRAEEWSSAPPRTAAELREFMGQPRATVIGPAYHGAAECVSATAVDGCQITEVDPVTLEGFATLADTDPQGWRGGGLDGRREAVFGALYGGREAALCNYKIDGADGARIGVFTAPEFCGKGIGRAVASACAANAAERGFLALWQTLESNVPSVRLAESIGFKRAGNHLALQLQ